MILTFPAKTLRSSVIKGYIGNRKTVCFSCGNASRELKLAGVDTIEIGKHGIFTPNHWFTQKEIVDIFPDCFDATPGHLSIELMTLIGRKYKQYLDRNNLINLMCYDILCGSGETLVCLKLAYPEKHFNAIYNVKDLEEATEYNENAPLNNLVELLADKVIKEGSNYASTHKGD